MIAMKRLIILINVLLFILFMSVCWADSQSSESTEAALVMAAWEGDHGKIQTLLSGGADVNGRYYADTALIRAIVAKRIATVKLLLEAGANPNLPSAQGTPLYHAVTVASIPDIVALLLKFGAEPNLTYEKDIVKNTPLTAVTMWSLSSEAEQVEITRQLIKAGAKVEQANSHGTTPLRNAIRGNRFLLVKLLLKAGADPNRVTDVKYVDFESGEVPLFEAIAQYGLCKNTRVISLLLDYGANVNYQNDRKYNDALRGHEFMWSGTSPLILASEMGYTEVVKLLLERGANPCLNRTDGVSPYAIAYNAGHNKTAMLLNKYMKEKCR
jgi:ankyrin repeat protein